MKTEKQKLISKVASRLDILGLSYLDTQRVAKVLVTGKHSHWDNEDYLKVVLFQCLETEVTGRVVGNDLVLYAPNGNLVYDIFLGKIEVVREYTEGGKVRVRIWEQAA